MPAGCGLAPPLADIALDDGALAIRRSIAQANGQIYETSTKTHQARPAAL